MSDFLRKLKEAVDSGKPNESINAGFNEILSKADKIAADPNALKQIEERFEKVKEELGIENQKKLTLEEVERLNLLAQQEEDKMLENEQKALVTSGVIAVNCEIETIEQEIDNRKKLIERYKSERDALINEDAPYHEKKQRIDKLIFEFNSRGKNG